jgi:Dolichyl-phosphate-mannose-protein mannosyltransferase
MARAIGLFFAFVALYFLTFTGHPISTDEMQYLDAALSFARDESLELRLSNNLINYMTPPGDMPFAPLNTEPLQTHFDSWLVRLAKLLPNIGVAHMVWLLHIFTTAGTVALFYILANRLGYGPNTSFQAAVILGCATMLWPYSQMHFREPLLMFLGTLAAVMVLVWRQNHFISRRGVLALAAAVGAFWLANETKDGAILYAPALLVLAFPSNLADRFFRLRRLLQIALVGGFTAFGALATLLIFTRIPAIAARLASPQFIQNLSFTPTALAGYLISPGFSLWAFSPILLIGFWGAWRLIRDAETVWGGLRQLLVPPVALVAFALGYATLHGQYWYGGLGWGPRFLLPVVPFFALWLLPVLAFMEQNHRLAARLTQVVFALLAAFSIAVQLLGTFYPTATYSLFLEEESARLGQPVVAWQQGVWDVRYYAPAVVLRQSPSTALSPAWSHTDQRWLPWLALLIALLAVWSAWNQARWRIAFAALATMLCLIVGLRGFYEDPRYGGQDPILAQILAILNTQAGVDDAIILENRAFRLFMMNYYKGPARVFALPDAGGETINPNEPPYIVSDLMEERAEPGFQMMFARIADRSARWWFLTESTPYSTTRYRVTEHHLTTRYFPVREAFTTDRARLILFDHTPAPPNITPPFAAQAINADFGVAMLTGFDAPHGLTVKAGQVLPISLLWKHTGWPTNISPFDYSINLTLINAESVTQAQRAGPPMATFANLSLWQKGAYYRDNHGLEIPAVTAPGEYDLWVLVFDWRDGSNLPVRRADGSQGMYVSLGRVTVE